MVNIMAVSTIKITTANGYKLGGHLVRYPKNVTGQLTFSGEGGSVEDVYERPSIYKKNVEHDIIVEMTHAGGWGYMILGHNGYYFSCGYYVKDKAGALYFIKHTAGGRFICECDKRGQYISTKRVAALDTVTHFEDLHLYTFYQTADDMRADIAIIKKKAFKTLSSGAAASCATLIAKLNGVDYYTRLIEVCDNMSGALDIFENNGGRYSMSWDAWAHALHEEAERDAAADYIAAAWPCL